MRNENVFIKVTVELLSDELHRQFNKYAPGTKTVSCLVNYDSDATSTKSSVRFLFRLSCIAQASFMAAIRVDKREIIFN